MSSTHLIFHHRQPLGLDLERLERDELPARLFPFWRRVRVPRPEGDRAVWSPSGEQLGVTEVAFEERDRFALLEKELEEDKARLKAECDDWRT